MIRLCSLGIVLLGFAALSGLYSPRAGADDASTKASAGVLNLGKQASKAKGALGGVADYAESASEVVGVGEHDWGQWGGSSLRNNTPDATNLPQEWNPGEVDFDTGAWKKDTAQNIKW